MSVDKSKKIGKWYFGGLASAGAACCTHPLDLLKVHLQTAGKDKSMGLVGMTGSIVRNQGILALYNGLSASLLRQLTYSTTRFAIYDVSMISTSYYSTPNLTDLTLRFYVKSILENLDSQPIKLLLMTL